MNISDYVASFHVKVKPPKADIVERWNTRVVPQGLDKAGRMGAGDYLSRYGKGISAKKVADLALMAEHAGASEMAAGFWEKAYQLETGNSESYGAVAGATPINVVTAVNAPSVVLAGLPSDFQPGRISTMQPVDAQKPQSHYILSPEYIGQPKRDGNRNVVFATPTSVAHQSRSTKVKPTFAAAFDEAAKKAASSIGVFVVDGEKVYLSAEGKEHRTSSQAATENVNLGRGTEPVVIKYSIFKALFLGGSLLDATEDARIAAGVKVVEAICKHNLGGVIVEATPTACTTAEKVALAAKQKADGREGEVWTKRSCAYTGGKGHVTDTVRTKYIIRVKCRITDVVPSTAQGRPVAAFVVSDLNGVALGKVGTGFDAAAALDLWNKHKANPGTVVIPVLSQGLTENGQLWHARLDNGEEDL